MSCGVKTTEFWFLVAVTIIATGLIVGVIVKEGTQGLPMLATVLPFLFGGAGWYQVQRNKVKAKE